MNISEDQRWMKEALGEARKGIGLTSPNPPVGAVIVKGGREISRGWHRKAGTAHAEVSALGKLEPGEAAGATIYVTLEPCSTEGKTGACCQAIQRAGLSRVVYGTSDPNPDHEAAADRILEEAGITLETGVLEDECQYLIRAFAKVQRSGLPWVIAKTAISLDGRISRPSGEGQWLTGLRSRENVQLLRAEADAIITSGRTVRMDNPSLTLRSEAISRDKVQPWRVVVTRAEMDREGFAIFNDRFSDRTMIRKKPDLVELLRELAGNYEVNTVLIESGGNLLGSFLDQELVDEVSVYLAPMVVGGAEVGSGGTGVAGLSERISLKQLTFSKFGQDLHVRGLIERGVQVPLER